MISALSTDDKTLMDFASEADATTYAEGINAEGDIWHFLDDCSFPLAAIFTAPSQRGSFLVLSGTYNLEPGQGQSLSELLPEVASAEGAAPLNTVTEAMELSASNLAVKRDAPQAARHTLNVRPQKCLIHTLHHRPNFTEAFSIAGGLFIP